MRNRVTMYVLVLLFLCKGIIAFDQAPRFTANMNKLVLSEDTPVGRSIYILKGYDPDFPNNPRGVTYGMRSDAFRVNPYSGEVRLLRKLDYEKEQSVDVWVLIFDTGSHRTEDLATKLLIRVIIRDVNDVPPLFTKDTYEKFLSEATPVDSDVFNPIEVKDQDTVNPGKITVVCEPDPLQPQTIQACQTFRVVEIGSNNKRWLGKLVLNKKLDYEEQSIWQIPLMSNDGLNKYRKSIEIQLTDVQDTPPMLIGSSSVEVDDGFPAGGHIIQAKAEDGDTGVRRKMFYEIIDNPGNLFAIDGMSGNITTVQILDREKPILSTGFVTIKLKVREIIDAANAVYGNDHLSTAVGSVVVTVRDLNDNAPIWTPKTYSAVINEDISVNIVVPNLLMSVNDPDKGNNGRYKIELLNHKDKFSIEPSEGQSLTTANVKIINKFDYEKDDRQIVLMVKAVEYLTAEKRSDTATVTIQLTDVNDNIPTFDKFEYIASVIETASGGTPVIKITATDDDSGAFGTTGLKYSLIGNGAEKFTVNPATGQITVAPCATPGKGNCLDYEKDKVYLLNFIATDNNGNGLSVSKPLIVNIIDDNDNGPTCERPLYAGRIREGDTSFNPTLIIKAKDLDSSLQNNQIRYSITGGNGMSLFQISETTGLLTPKAPLDYEQTPGGNGRYQLSVKATDSLFSVVCDVSVVVMDMNDHKPNFVPSNVYEEEIAENTPPKTDVIKVTAQDSDQASSSNGKVSYRIESGSLGKFVIDQVTGQIKTANQVVFDYDVQKKYIMTVIASDAGRPQKSATARVIINIRDANNKNPYFPPDKSVIRVRVYENSTLDTNVVKVKAFDPDLGAVLKYSITPTGAYTKGGIKVDPNQYDYKNLFKIDQSGQISTASLLNYDKVAELYLRVTAQDTNATSLQTGTGTVVVDILDINELPPTFASPWTLQLPNYKIKLREEMPTPSFVMTAVASDRDGVIESYEMLTNPGNYFRVDSATGVVVSIKRIDYEKVQNLNFVITAKDSGQPTLTATATVDITVENINDVTPDFQKIEYLTEIFENSPKGTYIVTVNATDADFGDFGLVRYALLDQKFNFEIDTMTGRITVKEGAVLDRESTPIVTMQAEVYDSPNTPSVRKRSTVPVYVKLKDVNDNYPKFQEAEYFATIIETTPVHNSVLKVRASDRDEGIRADLRYNKVWGDAQELFLINDKSGLITVNKKLNGTAGTYRIGIQAKDMQGQASALWTNATVTIKVIDSNNGAPKWLKPPSSNWTIGVLENQYLGMIIYQVLAIDEDKGPSGQITYGFLYNDKFVDSTPEFGINPITGVIRAEQVYDREYIQSYNLLLVAKDSGDPAFETTRFLIIEIKDVDDNQPEFPRFQNGTIKPYNFFVPENAKAGMFLGQITATDKDLQQYARIYYHIVYGNELDSFRLERDTGKLYMKKKLDREARRKYRLEIRATNVINPQKSKLITKKRKKRAIDASFVIVNIVIGDVDDNIPSFQYPQYSACVSVKEQIGKKIMTMKAIDNDVGQAGVVNYELSNVRNFKEEVAIAVLDVFSIGSSNGVIYLGKSMASYKNSYFKFEAKASNPGQSKFGKTSGSIYVTEPTETVKVVINRSPSDVNRYLQDYVKALAKSMEDGNVCVSDLRFHAGEDKRIHLDKTDLHYHVINPFNGKIYPSKEVANKANSDLDGSLRGDFAVLYIGSFSVVQSEETSWRYQPMLIIMIIVICIIIITAVLLVIACCFFSRSYRKQMNAAKQGTLKSPEAPEHGQFNPLWEQDKPQSEPLTHRVAYSNAAYQPDT